MEELIKGLEQRAQNGKDNTKVIMKALDMMIMVTRDKTAMLLKKSMQIAEKDGKIIDKFLKRNNYTKKEQELTLSFYEQIDKLYEDFIKELNIN